MKRKSIILGALLAALGAADSYAFVPGGTLDPTTIPKYKNTLPIPAAMPKSGTIGSDIDYYQIAARQFQQQILPDLMPKTTVWGYGALNDANSFQYPARTIEATVNRPVRVNWINDLKDSNGNFLPHLVAIDQTLDWANPPKDCIDGMMMTDCRGKSQLPYKGPVPLVAHLHGAHVGPATAIPKHGSCPTPATSRPAMRPRAPTTTRSTAPRQCRARPSTSTPTTSGPRHSGSMTTSWG